MVLNHFLSPLEKFPLVLGNQEHRISEGERVGGGESTLKNALSWFPWQHEFTMHKGNVARE